MRLAIVLLMLLAALVTVSLAFAQEMTPTPVTYVIRGGDTLGSIARRYGITLRALMQANDISNPELIYAGQTLIIPPETPQADATITATLTPTLAPTDEASTYIVQRGDTLARIAARSGSTVSAILRANNLSNPDVIYVGQELIIPGSTGALPVEPLPEATDEFAAARVEFDYGIEVYFPDENIAPWIEHVTALSMNWVKVNVYWRDLETTEGEIDVTQLDDVVDALDSAGLNILFTVTTSPTWAGADENSPPDDFNIFAGFIGALTQHYAGVVDGYEIWSEPNTRQMWNNAAHPLVASSYVDLLRASYTAVKTADPAASVISAGLAPIALSSDTALNDREYLTGMYAAGLREVSDSIGVRPFGFGNSPDFLCCTSTETSYVDNASYYFLSTLSDYRSIMTQNGDTSSQVWITGFGWGSSEDTTPPADDETYVSYNTLEEQSIYTGRAYEVAAQLGFVGPMILSNLNGCVVDQNCYYSLLSPVGEQRPVYNIVRILFTPAQ